MTDSRIALGRFAATDGWMGFVYATAVIVLGFALAYVLDRQSTTRFRRRVQAIFQVNTPQQPLIVGRNATAGRLQIRVLEQLLGGGLSGRLNMVLREQLGLTYGAGAFHNFGYDGGAFFAGGSTKTKSAAEFTEALIDLLRQPGSEAVEAVELRRLLSKISGEFALEVEDIDTISMKTLQQRLFGLPPDFWERYRSDVESISAEDLQKTTRSLLVDQAVQIVVVGRADKLKKELASFGEVRVYDTDLKRLE